MRRGNNQYQKCRNFFILLLIVFGSFFCTSNSYAQTRISIPVEQAFQINSGNLNKKEQTGVYLLKPMALDNPLPNNADTYQLVLTGNERKAIGDFYFSQSGCYSYQLLQQIPTAKEGFVYDDEVYKLTFYVSNTLEVEVIVENSNKMKTDLLSFVNTYDESSVINEKNSENEEQSHEDAHKNKQSRLSSVYENIKRHSLFPKTGDVAKNGWLFIGGLFLLLAGGIYCWKLRAIRRK